MRSRYLLRTSIVMMQWFYTVNYWMPVFCRVDPLQRRVCAFLKLTGGVMPRGQVTYTKTLHFPLALLQVRATTNIFAIHFSSRNIHSKLLNQSYQSSLTPQAAEIPRKAALAPSTSLELGWPLATLCRSISTTKATCSFELAAN